MALGISTKFLYVQLEEGNCQTLNNCYNYGKRLVWMIQTGDALVGGIHVGNKVLAARVNPEQLG